MAGPSSSLEPFTAGGDHTLLAVRITPKASRNAIGTVLELPDGRHALGVRIAAPPVDGAANAELVGFLAKSLGIARGDVTIRSGETGRLKIVRIGGDTNRIAAALRVLISENQK